MHECIRATSRREELPYTLYSPTLTRITFEFEMGTVGAIVIQCIYQIPDSKKPDSIESGSSK